MLKGRLQLKNVYIRKEKRVKINYLNFSPKMLREEQLKPKKTGEIK